MATFGDRSWADCQFLAEALNQNVFNYNTVTGLCEVRSCDSLGLVVEAAQDTEVYIATFFEPSGKSLNNLH